MVNINKDQFNSDIQTIGKIAIDNNLYIPNVSKSNGFETQEIQGMVKGRRISIFINYTSWSITWTDRTTGENKTIRY